MPVQDVLGDLAERFAFVDTGVVHQNVEPAKRFLRLGKEPLNVFLFGDVRLHGNGSATIAGNLSDDAIRISATRRVIDDDRRAFRCERVRDGRADAFRCTSDDGDFACKFFVSHFDSFPIRSPTRLLRCGSRDVIAVEFDENRPLRQSSFVRLSLIFEPVRKHRRMIGSPTPPTRHRLSEPVHPKSLGKQRSNSLFS
jgi:hypothetical protein